MSQHEEAFTLRVSFERGMSCACLLASSDNSRYDIYLTTGNEELGTVLDPKHLWL